MKLNVNFRALHDCVRMMSAAERKFDVTVTLPVLADVDTLLTGDGIVVELDDIEIKSNGLLSYKGRQVLLYIQDHGWKITDSIENGALGNKYHVAYCETLDKMHSRGRYDRYVAKHDISGYFYIDGNNKDTDEYEDGETQLKVCKNCLKHLSYNGYTHHGQNKEIFSSFALEEFFSNYQKYFKFKPKYQAGKNRSKYADNWRETSSKYRSCVNWVCEKCKVNCIANKSLLHSHHRNGVKSDDSIRNLQALCAECHTKQPSHSHMGLKHEHKQQLQELRLTQGAVE